MNSFLDRLPSTNFRVFVGVCLAVLFVVGNMALYAVDSKSVLDAPRLEIVAWAVFGILAVDTAHFIGKRATHKGPPPSDEAVNPPDLGDR